MFIKTNIPETTMSLVAYVDFGDQMFDQDEIILNDRTNQIQAIISGNRCGHMPDAPRFFSPPNHHKRRPTVLDRAIDMWEVVYRKAKKFFKKLATTHDDGRQVRSERREAIAAVSQVLLHYLELSSLRIGFYAGNKFIHLDIEYIAKKAGLSFSRAKRAITALAKAGYIKISRQYKKKEDGTFDGEPSIREIAVQFFIDLGMDVHKLFFAREWKRKQEEKKRAKESLKKLKGMIQGVTSFRKKTLPVPGKQYMPLSEQETMKKKAIMNRAMELHKANPERSWIEYLKELMQPLE